MSFKYSCIGDNTEENKECLGNLGYNKWAWSDESNDLPFLSTISEIGEYVAYEERYLTASCFQDDINCIGNSELFKAVTAIRDDDYMQWFTDGKEWTLCPGKHFYEWYYYFALLRFDHNAIHKATLSELQEHFKKKE